MPIRLECNCGRRLNLDDKLLGKRIKCPECGNALRVNGQSPAAKPPELAAEPMLEEDLEATVAVQEKPKKKPAPSGKKKPEEKPEKITAACLEGIGKFVIKEQGKPSKKTYEIYDEEENLLAIGRSKTGFLEGLMGGITIGFVQSADNSKLFAIQRSGLFMKKVQVLSAGDKVLGAYKAKMFSLSGGFHIYDKAGKHIAEIKGKMFSSNYTILTPDGEEIGTVSTSWGGLAKSLFTGKGTFGVQIAPAFAEDVLAKIRILGATIAINAIFKAPKGKKGGGGGGAGGSEEEDGGSVEVASADE
jgi:uncharacterized protein YxjI